MTTWKVIAVRDGEQHDLSYDNEQDAALGALGMAVTGYTARVVEISETGHPYVPLDWTGAVTTCSDCGNDAPDEPCKRVHNQPDGPLCQPCRVGQLMVHLFCWRCGGDRFLWCRTGVVEYATVLSFNDDDEAVVDDRSWESDSGSGGYATWVECEKCHTHLMTSVSYDVMA